MYSLRIIFTELIVLFIYLILPIFIISNSNNMPNPILFVKRTDVDNFLGFEEWFTEVIGNSEDF
jgi:hypothetical protein